MMEQMKDGNSGSKSRIPIDEKGLEYKKWRNNIGFPVRSGFSSLASYCNNAFDFHWHDGPELSVVVEGSMEYLVNDKCYLMKQGDCVFVNSGAMHSGRSSDGGNCVYLVVSFLMSALDSDASGYFAEKYFGGIMESESLASMFFPAESESCGAISALCRRIEDARREKADGWELEARGFLFELWGLLRREAQRTSGAGEERSASVARIKKAICYMNDNYGQKLTLEEIAESCNLSKSEFCRCFKRITRQTPFDYLLDLRIRKSLRLLAEGNSVTETALASGFSGSSYYTEVFRRYMNCTPREYLKRAGKKDGK